MITGYKGFDKNLKCSGGFQYEVGKTYREKKAVLCECGIHYCKNPLDVFKHYPPGTSRYALVEDTGSTIEESGKSVTTRLKIARELTLREMVEAGVKYVKKHGKKDTVSEKDWDSLAAAGDDSTLAAMGIGSALASAGTGSKLAAAGIGSTLAATGDGSTLAAAGDDSKLVATGDCSTLTAAGYGSRLTATGKNSLVVGLGSDSSVSGGLGSLLVLVLRNPDGTPKGVISGIVDGINLLPGVAYAERNGQFYALSD